jgi:hypothetical protein
MQASKLANTNEGREEWLKLRTGEVSVSMPNNAGEYADAEIPATAGPIAR